MKKIGLNQNYMILILMVLIAVAAYFMRPVMRDMEAYKSLKLIEVIPKEFADWREVPSKQVQMDLVPRKEDGAPSMDSPYDDTLMRTYVNSKGQIVQLALAYGKSQRQEVKIHRPELCYYAQGFQVQSLVSSNFQIASTQNKQVIGKNMLVTNSAYQEAVSYWIRIGDLYSESPWQTRFYIIKQGLTGEVPDGVLVRASSILSDAEQADKYYQINQTFLKELINSIQSNSAKKLLVN